MSYKVVCDNCGKEQTTSSNNDWVNNPINPETNTQWYSRRNNRNTIHACSRRCLEQYAEKSGSTNVVLPF